MIEKNGRREVYICARYHSLYLSVLIIRIRMHDNMYLYVNPRAADVDANSAMGAVSLSVKQSARTSHVHDTMFNRHVRRVKTSGINPYCIVLTLYCVPIRITVKTLTMSLGFRTIYPTTVAKSAAAGTKTLRRTHRRKGTSEL